MKAQSITVQKISQKSRQSDIEINVEMIRLDHVRSVRVWKKTKEEKEVVEGDILYLTMKDEQGKEGSVRIAESFDHYETRVNAIKMLHQGKVSTDTDNNG